MGNTKRELSFFHIFPTMIINAKFSVDSYDKPIIILGNNSIIKNCMVSFN